LIDCLCVAGCRVIINTNHKKFEGTLVGKEGTVLSITSNGWVKLQVRMQQQQLMLLMKRSRTSQQRWLGQAAGVIQQQQLMLALCHSQESVSSDGWVKLQVQVQRPQLMLALSGSRARVQQQLIADAQVPDMRYAWWCYCC
jgi:hypothetical protein